MRWYNKHKHHEFWPTDTDQSGGGRVGTPPGSPGLRSSSPQPAWLHFTGEPQPHHITVSPVSSSPRQSGENPRLVCQLTCSPDSNFLQWFSWWLMTGEVVPCHLVSGNNKVIVEVDWHILLVVLTCSLTAEYWALSVTLYLYILEVRTDSSFPGIRGWISDCQLHQQSGKAEIEQMFSSSEQNIFVKQNIFFF